MELNSASKGAPCSSSSPSRDFGALLRRSLDALQAEHPAAYAQLARALGRVAVAVSVAGERSLLTFSGEHCVAPAPQEISAPVELATDWATLDALLDGKMTLLSAVRNERLYLRGAIADLGRFHEGLMLYLRGAVRCPSFPSLRADVRAAARRKS